MRDGVFRGLQLEVRRGKQRQLRLYQLRLDAPVKARALRVESANPSQPLALTEVEAYGPEDAEDTPAPAPAEK